MPCSSRTQLELHLRTPTSGLEMEDADWGPDPAEEDPDDPEPVPDDEESAEQQRERDDVEAVNQPGDSSVSTEASTSASASVSGQRSFV